MRVSSNRITRISVFHYQYLNIKCNGTQTTTIATATAATAHRIIRYSGGSTKNAPARSRKVVSTAVSTLAFLGFSWIKVYSVPVLVCERHARCRKTKEDIKVTRRHLNLRDPCERSWWSSYLSSQ